MREDTIVHHLIKEKYPHTLLRTSQTFVSKKHNELGSTKSSFLFRIVKPRAYSERRVREQRVVVGVFWDVERFRWFRYVLDHGGVRIRQTAKSDNQFLFLVEIYHSIMTRVTNFFDTMEQSDIDARKSRSTVQHFSEPVSRVWWRCVGRWGVALSKKNMHSPGEQKKQQDRRHSNLRYTKDNHLRKILIHLAFKCRPVV